MKLGHVLKMIRVSRELNQGKMDDVLGLSQNYLYLRESDKRKPSNEKINEFAASLGISKEALLFLSYDVPDELGEEDKGKFRELQKHILSLIIFETTGKLKESA